MCRTSPFRLPRGPLAEPRPQKINEGVSMRHWYREALLSICAAVVCLSAVALAQTPFPCKITTTNKTCLTVGPLPPQNPQGWIVGEIKTFAVGTDSKDLMD